MSIMVFARFDDVKPGRSRSFALVSPIATFQTVDTEEVLDVLAVVEAEVERGRWVAGWVSYEAASGVSPALTVRDGSESAFRDLSLAWFGVFEACQQAPEFPSAGSR